MKKDPNFRIYPVIFGVTVTTNSTPPVIRPMEVGSSRNAPKIDIPDAWIKAEKDSGSASKA
jgi:hypothetical protein